MTGGGRRGDSKYRSAARHRAAWRRPEMQTVAGSSAGGLGRRSAYTNILQKPSLFPSAMATLHRPLSFYALSAGSLALSRQSQMSIAIFPSCTPDSRCEKAVQIRSSG